MAEAKHKQHGHSAAIAPARQAPSQDRQAQGRDTLTANQPPASAAETFRTAADQARTARERLERALAAEDRATATLAAVDLRCALAAAAAAAQQDPRLLDDARELEAGCAAILDRAPAVPARANNDRVVDALGNTHTEPAIKRAPSDHPAFSPQTKANMTIDVNAIVEKLNGMWLGEGDQLAIVERVERWARVDAALSDLYPNATHYTDRFLDMLRLRHWKEAMVFDELWNRLTGSAGARFRQVVWSSSNPTGADRKETLLDAVLAPTFWHATSLLSFGIVDASLFDEMFAAKGNTQRLGIAMVRVERAVVDLVTFGAARPAYQAAVAYATKHPGCSLHEVIGAGVLAAADAVLPRPELTLIAKALGVIGPDAGELPPDTAQAVQAFFQGAMKVIMIGAIIHAKVQAGRAREQVREELTPNRERPANTANAANGPKGTPPAPPRAATPPRPAPPRPMPPARVELLRNIRKAAGDHDIVLWEQVPLGELYEGVRAGSQAAEALGVPAGSVIGYVVKSGKVTGSAIGDMMHVETTAAPYPDPFIGKPSMGPLGTPGGGKSLAPVESPHPTTPSPQPRSTTPAPSRPTTPSPRSPTAASPRANAPTSTPRPTNRSSRPATSGTKQFASRRAKTPRPMPPGQRNPALISQLKWRSVPSDKRGRPNPDFDPNTPGHIAAHFKREQARTNSDSPTKWREPEGFEAQHPNGRPNATHGEPLGTRLHWGTKRDHDLQSAREEGKTPRKSAIPPPIPGPDPGKSTVR